MSRILLALLILVSALWSATPVWKWKLVDSLPHPRDRFTQGLFWDGGMLYESTGEVGHSRVFRMNAKGRVLDSTNIPPPHFGEGIARVGKELLVLTWQSRRGFVLDANNLKQTLGEFPLSGEGWGLASAPGTLWLSDGSASLFRMSPTTKAVTGKIQVRDLGRAVSRLNELEVVGSKIFANVWYSDSIAVIHPEDGHVVAWIDCAPLAERIRKANPHADVLNGIAWDGRRLWVTGKLWPKLFALEISGIPKSPK